METPAAGVTPTRRSDRERESTLRIDNEIVGGGDAIVARIGREGHRESTHAPESSEVEHRHARAVGSDEKRVIRIDLDVLRCAIFDRQQTDIYGAGGVRDIDHRSPSDPPDEGILTACLRIRPSPHVGNAPSQSPTASRHAQLREREERKQIDLAALELTGLTVGTQHFTARYDRKFRGKTQPFALDAPPSVRWSRKDGGATHSTIGTGSPCDRDVRTNRHARAEGEPRPAALH